MNKTFCRRSVLLTVVNLLLVSFALSQETPQTMLKITTRLTEPAPESGAFQAQAKTCWRAGTKYGRIAEAPDPQNRIHGLTIIDEPNAWMINLYDKSGRHIVDPGPSFNVRVPIFQTPGAAKMKVYELEFGEELEFFKANNATRSAGGAVHGKATERYEVTVSGRRLVLWIESKTEKPVRISLVKGMETQTIEYLSYDELPFDPLLFQPPSGITLVDAR